MISEREVAYRVLLEAIKHRAYINLELKKISHPNMPFVSALVYGVMQNYRQCRHVVAPFITRKVSVEVDVILMMSVYQTHYMHDIPHYAIKAEAMKLCETYAPHAKHFVHAVVEKGFTSKLFVAEHSDQIEAISLETSFEPWIIAMWKAHYGMAFARAFAHFSNQPAPLFGFVHYRQQARLEHCAHAISPWGFKADRTLLSHPDFLNHNVFIADIHAQVVGFNTPIQKNEKVLDACGAPGGKSLMMAMATHDNATIICADIAPHRLKLVEESVQKAGIKSITTQVLDARFAHETFENGYFDGILIDAPCSGLGVLRRKPEIKMFITPEDIDALVLVQADILQSCSQCLKVGGWLVYSTCTVNKKENEKQIERFLLRNSHFTLEEIVPMDSLMSGGDGFFMAKLRKIQ